MWQQWINLILGLWIIASAYIGLAPSSMVTNLTISGIIVAALALWGALKHTSHTTMMGQDESRHSHA